MQKREKQKEKHKFRWALLLGHVKLTAESYGKLIARPSRFSFLTFIIRARVWFEKKVLS